MTAVNANKYSDCQGPRSHGVGGPGGQLTPHFFRYGVNIRRLTPHFLKAKCSREVEPIGERGIIRELYGHATTTQYSPCQCHVGSEHAASLSEHMDR